MPDAAALRGLGMEGLRQAAETCTACPLARTRHSVVFGEGNEDTDLVFVGEAPGQQEDLQGRPFVGAAGQLLDRILEAAGIVRSEVYITNTVMCRPPGNRVPTPEERSACRPFFDAKLRRIGPKIVVLLGATAAQSILGPDIRITRDRGRIVERDGVQYIPTFHPAALLRDPAKKRPVWQDIQKVRDLYRNARTEGTAEEDASSAPARAPGSEPIVKKAQDAEAGARSSGAPLPRGVQRRLDPEP